MVCLGDAVPARALGRPACVSSSCPVTKEAVTVEVDSGRGVTGVAPQGTLLSFPAAPAPFAGELVAGFCRWIHFLADASAVEAWLAGSGTNSDRPPMIALSLDDGGELGRRTNHAVSGVPGGDGRARRARPGAANRPEAWTATRAARHGPAPLFSAAAPLARTSAQRPGAGSHSGGGVPYAVTDRKRTGRLGMRTGPWGTSPSNCSASPGCSS